MRPAASRRPRRSSPSTGAQEREAEREARREAAAHNQELGVAVVKGFGRVKLDERVVKLLATLPLGSDLEQLALRGARYGFPGWVEESETKSGKRKTVYIDRREEAGAKAREYLSVAKTGQELAGRLLALVAMARYADERAVAQSGRSFYHLPLPAGLPWQGDIVDLIDELAAERLPDHLTKALRERRARERAEEERLERSGRRPGGASRPGRSASTSCRSRSSSRSSPTPSSSTATTRSRPSTRASASRRRGPSRKPTGRRRMRSRPRGAWPMTSATSSTTPRRPAPRERRSPTSAGSCRHARRGGGHLTLAPPVRSSLARFSPAALLTTRR